MIHKKAHTQGSTIPESCNVWQFASVIRGAELGENVTVASGAIVDGVKVGDGSLICHGASIHPGAILGVGVFIGPGAVICNDSWPRTHKRGWEAPTKPVVIIEDGASVGANCVVLPGVRIGKAAMIAAGVTVSRDVPDRYLLSPKGLEPIGNDANKERMRYAAGVTP